MKKCLRMGRKCSVADQEGCFLCDEEVPEAAPVGYVETLPGKPKRKGADVVKIGWGSERLNRRSKRAIDR